MFEFLIFGGLWFWILTTIFIFAAISSAINESDGFVWIFGIILIFILFLSGIINWAWVVANPLMLLLYVAIYIAVGIIWSIKEWYDYCLENAKNNSKFVSTYVEGGSLTPTVSNEWSTVTTWIVYFPIFVLGWILTEPIKKIAEKFSFIYNFISKKVNDKIVKDIEKSGTKNQKNN